MVRIKRITEKYPERFSFVTSPDTYYGLKKVTNHTKCTVIDFGKYFILGGSGVKDSFAQTGIENLSVEKFKKESRWSDSEGEEKAKSANFGRIVENGSYGFIEQMISNNFRDQDFVFEDDSEDHQIGKTMYRQALMLAYKWDQFKMNSSYFGNSLPSETWNIRTLQFQSADVIKKFRALSDDNAQDNVTPNETALYTLLMTKIPDLDQVDTDVFSFGSSSNKVEHVPTELYFTGPEDSGSPFHKEMVKSIEEANKEIVIDHMYFQPSTELMNALISAANRGVKITIVTAGVTKNCAKAESFFGPRNAYNYYYLISGINKELQKNVNVYLYEQEKRGLHKKVMIVDDKVLAGSSNMGYKSLELTGDHEMNFIAQSQDLVNETLKVISKDIELSTKVDHPEQISFKEIIAAGVHSLGARIWG